MRKFIALFATVILLVGWVTPVLAAGFGLSPAEVEFQVPADSSKKVEFMAYNFSGDLQVSLENIPLRVEPTTIAVNAPVAGTKISLTFYGDESLGSKIYQGKIRFLASTGSMVATGIKVRATVTNIVEGETPVLVEYEAPQSTSPTQQETSSPSQSSQNPSEEPSGVTVLPSTETPNMETSGNTKLPLPPSPSGGTGELPILAIVGIAAGALVVIVLIIVLIRRPRY